MPSFGSPTPSLHPLEVLLGSQSLGWTWPYRGLILSCCEARALSCHTGKWARLVPRRLQGLPSSLSGSGQFLAGTWAPTHSCAECSFVCVCRMNEWLFTPHSFATQKRRVTRRVSTSCPRPPASPSRPYSCKASLIDLSLNFLPKVINPEAKIHDILPVYLIG